MTTAPPNGTIIEVRPGQSLNAAVASAPAGSTVRVRAGGYPRLNITDRAMSRRVTVTAASGEVVTVGGIAIDGSIGWSITGFASTDTVQMSESHDITLDRISVRNPSTATVCGPANNAFGICNRSSNISISNSTTVGGFRSVAIYGRASLEDQNWVRDITLTGNDFGGSVDDVIQVVGAYDVRIVGNYIHDPQVNAGHNDGVQVVFGQRIDIVGNRFTHANGDGGADQGIIISSGTDARNVRDVVIANNLIDHWKGSGLTICGGTNVSVVNNTSVDNDFGLMVSRGSTTGGTSIAVNLRIWNNVWDHVTFTYGASRADIAFESNNLFLGRGAGGSNAYTGDAAFVDPSLTAAHGFQIGAASAARNRGLSIAGTPTTDRRGVTRSAPVDIGAYEYVG